MSLEFPDIPTVTGFVRRYSGAWEHPPWSTAAKCSRDYAVHFVPICMSHETSVPTVPGSAGGPRECSALKDGTSTGAGVQCVK